ncbi:hypothetical protein ACQY0O_005117 [Thecaphora frezii]
MDPEDAVELAVEKDDRLVQPMATSQQDTRTGASQRRSRRAKWTPPASLQDHFRRKGYLSVTELASPSWCEYNYQYSVLGALSTLPASERPATITTPEGATLQPSLAVLEEKERVLDRGKAVHAQLEKEAQPGDAVELDTTTREDVWAARLLDTWCKLEWLRKGGVAREVELCGWIGGEFVRGVVDEIVRRLLVDNTATSDRDDDAGKADGGKVWASQEEWKRDMKRRTKKKVTPDKPGAKLKLTKLDGFGFGSASAPKQPAAADAADDDAQPPPAAPPAEASSQAPSQSTEAHAERQGWGYFLSDTKTRVSPFLPAEEDQAQARKQCMIYKRLFDGMCLGALASAASTASPPPPSAESAPQAPGFDPHATPLDWTQTFVALSLSPHAALSSGFLASAVALCESWGCDLLSLPSLRHRNGNEKRSDEEDAVAEEEKEKEAEGVTLSDIASLLERGLCTLIQDACLGASRFRSDASASSQGRPEIMQSQLRLSYIHQPATLTRNPKRRSSPRRAATRYLGHVEFQHDAEALSAFLGDVLEMWKGNRRVRGVAIHETKRCWRCVWIEGCEWRERMADEALLRSRSGKKQGAVEGEAIREDEGREAEHEQVRGQEKMKGKEEAEDPDQDLWEQLDDVDDLDLSF